MSLGANKARLSESTRDLLFEWGHLRDGWRDARSEEFENKYLRELRADVDKAIGSLDEVEKLLQKMRRECE